MSTNEQLIGQIGFPRMIWLMLRGELPTAGQATLLEAAPVSSVNHGPHTPSIAIARMAVSCGLPLNGAMASALNTLGDVHGGAGQQALELFHAVDDAEGEDDSHEHRRRDRRDLRGTGVRATARAAAFASRGPWEFSRTHGSKAVKPSTPNRAEPRHRQAGRWPRQVAEPDFRDY